MRKIIKYTNELVNININLVLLGVIVVFNCGCNKAINSKEGEDTNKETIMDLGSDAEMEDYIQQEKKEDDLEDLNDLEINEKAIISTKKIEIHEDNSSKLEVESKSNLDSLKESYGRNEKKLVDGRELTPIEKLKGLYEEKPEKVKVDIYGLEYENIPEKLDNEFDKEGENYRKALQQYNENRLFIVGEREEKEIEYLYFSKLESVELIKSYLDSLYGMEKEIRDLSAKNNAAQMIALGLEPGVLRRSRALLAKELEFLTIVTEDLEKWKQQMEIYELSNKYKLRYFRRNMTLDLYTLLDRVFSEQESYNNRLISLSLWLEKNWEFFEDDFGERIIIDEDVEDIYNKKIKDLVRAKKDLISNQELFVNKWADIADLLVKEQHER